MIKKISITASEMKKIIRKILKLNKKGDVYLNFINEMESFILRNIIEKKECCAKCLKAYLVDTLKKSDSTLLIEKLFNFIEGETGHQGYYLDKEKLIKIS